MNTWPCSPPSQAHMCASIPSCWIGVLFYLATIFTVLGQDASQTQPIQQAAPSTQQVSQNQTPLQAFQQEQQTLFQERQALVDQGATSEQLAAWRQQNAPQFAALQQQAQAMAATSALQVTQTNLQANIPANASPTLTAFLTTQTALANARAQIHNQLVQAMPSNASAAQVNQMQQQEMQTFQQQHAGDLQLQAQRAQTLANESAQTPLSVLPPLVIPADATPQMAAFLTTRDQLMRARRQFHNQYATADPATRQAAMQRWCQQNAALIQQMQQQAQSLSQANSTTQN